MGVMGPEVTVDLGAGYGNIDRVRVSEGYGITYSDEGVEKLKRLSSSSPGGGAAAHVSELRYQTDRRPDTPVLQELPMDGSDLPIPLTPGSAHVSELHYRDGAVSPSVHKTVIAYNVGKFDENQNVFMNISSAPSPPPKRPHSGSWGHEPFWAAPHDTDKAKQLEKEAKLKTPPPGTIERIASPMDSKLVQMAEPSRPAAGAAGRGAGSHRDEYSGYSSDFDVYKQHEAAEKRASLRAGRGFDDSDLYFDFDSDPLLSTRVVKRRRKKQIDPDEAPKRLSDPNAYKEWEDDIAVKLDELGQRATERDEREQRRSRAERLARDTDRMLELMGDDIGGKVKTLRSRTDDLLSERHDDELHVDYEMDVEATDKTDAENINRASETVMKKLHALLADLQSTTSHITNYQGQSTEASHPTQSSSHATVDAPQPPSYQTVTSPHYAVVNYSHKTSPGAAAAAASASHRSSKSSTRSGSSGSAGASGAASREATPPPVPPHPTSSSSTTTHLTDSHSNHVTSMQSAQQPMYEPSALNRQQYTTTSYQKSTYSSYTSQGLPPGQFTPPAQMNPPPPLKPMTPLSNNLSELDMLLQDLSSAQFMAEVDRRNQANLQHGEPLLSRDTAGLASRAPGERSVDSLLLELENTVNPPRSPAQQHASSDIVPNHYEAVNRGLPNGGDAEDGRAPGAASTATRELDDLMDSLSDFKVADEPQHVGEPPYAQPNKQKVTQQPQPSNAEAGDMEPQRDAGTLDNMLGNLNDDMNKQGVMTVPKGNCAACSKPIVGQVITALGKIWHPEHFQCAHCTVELGTQNFFERDGFPYCEKDYHQLFSPMCAACGGPILDRCITAMDATWHPEHFVCASCGAAFGEEGFHEKDGKAFCREDYFSMFAPKCGGCSRPIMDNYISALNRQWHPECFVCMECGFPFGSGSFFDHDGLPYCETHYHAKRGSLCAGCHKPITGRCITAMYKKFHPEHFVCAFCLKQLNKGTFKEQNDKPYCHPCFIKLFG